MMQQQSYCCGSVLVIGAESEGDVGDRHRASAARSRIITVITQTVGCYLRQSGGVIILLGYSHRCYLSCAVYTPTTASAARRLLLVLDL